MENNILALIMSVFIIGKNPATNRGVPSMVLGEQVRYEKMISSYDLSLNNRHVNKYVNDVFKDNILLSLAYLSGSVSKKEQINWDKIRAPFYYEFILSPDEIFAFHEDVLDEYKSKVKITTNAHFNAEEGFKSDGFLYGDGVCHFASLINLTASEAKLKVISPTRHDFALIPEIPKQYGTSIYYYPGRYQDNKQQNLYVVNNFDTPVKFMITYNDNDNVLNISIFKLSN